MNSEGVYSYGEMLGVDLAKFFASAVVFEVVVHHVVRHLSGTNSVDLENLNIFIFITQERVKRRSKWISA